MINGRSEGEVLGSTFRLNRVLAGMATREELARRAGVKPKRVRQLEKGEVSSITVEEVTRMIRSLRLNPEGRAYLSSLVALEILSRL